MFASFCLHGLVYPPKSRSRRWGAVFLSCTVWKPCGQEACYDRDVVLFGYFSPIPFLTDGPPSLMALNTDKTTPYCCNPINCVYFLYVVYLGIRVVCLDFRLRRAYEMYAMVMRNRLVFVKKTGVLLPGTCYIHPGGTAVITKNTYMASLHQRLVSQTVSAGDGGGVVDTPNWLRWLAMMRRLPYVVGIPVMLYIIARCILGQSDCSC